MNRTSALGIALGGACVVLLTAHCVMDVREDADELGTPPEATRTIDDLVVDPTGSGGQSTRATTLQGESPAEAAEEVSAPSGSAGAPGQVDSRIAGLRKDEELPKSIFDGEATDSPWSQETEESLSRNLETRLSSMNAPSTVHSSVECRETVCRAVVLIDESPLKSELMTTISAIADPKQGYRGGAIIPWPASADGPSRIVAYYHFRKGKE